MKSLKRNIIIGVIAVLLLALPITAFAGQKKIFKAYLTQDSVVNSALLAEPRGVGILGVSPGGLQFQVSGSNLSPDSASLESTGGGDFSVHIHGAAPAGQSGPIVATLCGTPGPAVQSNCNVSEDGFLKIMGSLGKQHIVGMTAQEFMTALDNGELYIQVHSDGTPIIRGQLYEN